MEILINTAPRVGSTALYLLISQAHKDGFKRVTHKAHIPGLLYRNIDSFEQIVCFRDPKMAITSQLLYIYENAKTLNVEEHCKKNIFGVVLQHLDFYEAAKQNYKNITIVDFDDLVNNPESVLRKIIQKLKISSREEDILFSLNNLKLQKSSNLYKNNYPVNKPQEYYDILKYVESNIHLLDELYNIHKIVIEHKI